MALTDLQVKAENGGASRREIPDGRVVGLYLVVQPSGVKSWSFRYRANGTPRKLTLGSYPAVGLADARRLALEAASRVAGGADPAGEKSAARQAARQPVAAPSDTIESVVIEFIERHAKARTRDWKETERLLRRNVAAPWAGRRLSEITRRDVHTLLDQMIDRGAAVSANRTLAQLRKLCNWATERGIIETSPCAGIRAPTQETPRDRALSIADMRRVVIAAKTLGWPFGPIIELLALTGQRRDEIGGMTWGELDIEARTWTLPAARAKNRREHMLPLPPRAVETIETLPRFAESPFLFSSGKNPPSGWSVAKKRLDKALAAQGGPIEPFVIHDLRRSVATGMASIGVALPAIERVLNHVSGSFGGIVGVYQRHSYADEMRDALEKWEITLFSGNSLTTPGTNSI